MCCMIWVLVTYKDLSKGHHQDYEKQTPTYFRQAIF